MKKLVLPVTLRSSGSDGTGKRPAVRSVCYQNVPTFSPKITTRFRWPGWLNNVLMASGDCRSIILYRIVNN